MAKVYRADLWGLRKDKYKALAEMDISTTPWREVEPQAPFYLFTPQEKDLLEEYNQGWKITDIMPVNVLGFQTHRDHFAIDFDKIVIRKRMSDLRDSTLSDDALRSLYGLRDNRDWQLSSARKKLQNDEHWESRIIRCSYRPFDWRFAYFSEVAMDYPRRELLEHVFKKENICLLSSRQQGTLGYRHSWVAREPANDCVVSTRSREANQVFPLYLYPDPSKNDLFSETEGTNAPGGRRPNLAPKFIREFSDKLRLEFVQDGQGDLAATFGPENVFHYLYAIFHTPSYRERYAEFLKVDFPRVPLTSGRELFVVLCGLGEELVKVHLLEARGSKVATYPVSGNNLVEAVRYQEPNEETKGRVHINKAQYFEGVPPQVWNFGVGGYQVVQKWLKDRKGRALSFDDLEHYMGVVSALKETIRLMAEVEEAVEVGGGWPLC